MKLTSTTTYTLVLSQEDLDDLYEALCHCDNICVKMLKLKEVLGSHYDDPEPIDVDEIPF